MPSSRRLIASNTLTGTAASVTFSAIPGTYTDLVLRWTARDTVSGAYQAAYVRFNNASVNHSYTNLDGNGAAASSWRASNDQYIIIASIPGATATSNTFGQGEIYVPSYTASQNKPSSIFGVGEQNGTTAFIRSVAGLYSSTTAITRIDFIATGTAFASGSSFFLYGISNT